MEGNFKKFNEEAELLKVIAHPIRLCIVSGLLKKGQCNVSFMQNCMGLPQSTVSTHLAKLKAHGIIEGERNGLEVIYKVKNKKVEKIIEALLEE